MYCSSKAPIREIPSIPTIFTCYERQLKEVTTATSNKLFDSDVISDEHQIHSLTRKCKK
jgi:hypothetical protein